MCGILSNRTSSQNLCGFKSTTTSIAASSQPCIQFLDNFVPQSNDSTLKVNVRIYICQPNGSTGIWSNSTQVHADSLISEVNRRYSNICLPSLNIGSPTIAWTKIKFNLLSFSTIVNTSLYTNVGFYPIVNTFVTDTNCISIFFGDDSTPGMDFGFNPTLPIAPFCSNVITFNGNALDTVDNCGFALAHELGHALGLNHTQAAPANWQGDADADKSILFTNEGCCTKIIANDIVPDSTTFGLWIPCGTTSVSLSNNLMAYNGLCNCYLSPQQTAIMHYNLRTWKRNLLTNYSYNNHLKVNTAYDYTLSTNETWNNDRHFKGNVIVPANVHLTIQCLVSMTQGARIIVKPSGWVSVQGGTVTNISGHLWDGIQVAGAYGLDQSINSVTGFANNQGLLDVEYGGLLTNAGTACMNYTTDASNNVDFSSTGGIIRGYYGKFHNNSRDAEFLSYPVYATASIFKFCDFKTTRALNSGFPVFAHLSMWDVINVKVWGCNFEYAAGNAIPNAFRGMGIFSIDASYLLNKYCDAGGAPTYSCPTTAPSVFRKLNTGVRAGNLVMPTRTPYVYNSEFYDNERDAIYLQNAQNFIIDQNYIRTAPSYSTSGIYLNNSRFYSVKNNTLSENGNGQNATGLYAWQSLFGGHQVYRNRISGFYTGINAVENNSGVGNLTDGLKMNCNDFSSPQNGFDIAVMSSPSASVMPTVATEQGAIFNQNNTNLVRNIYAASCGLENKWYTDLYSSKVVEHGCNSNAVTQPTPQPACSRTIVNVVPSSIPLTFSIDCVPYPPSSGGGPVGTNDPTGETLSGINSNLAALLAEGEGADHFELEATLAAKLNYYALDPNPAGRDSIIGILQDYSTVIPDADLQLIFAQMHKGDYAAAETLAATLGTGREDWKELLQTVIDMYQEPDKIFSLNRNSTYQALMEEYAAEPYRDGSSLAQALLFFVQGTAFDEPRPRPDPGSERLAQPAGETPAPGRDLVKIFPNPTNGQLNISYLAKEEGPAIVEVRDLLGRIIYTNFIISGREKMVDLNPYQNGVYMITITKNREVLLNTKLIKQD